MIAWIVRLRMLFRASGLELVGDFSFRGWVFGNCFLLLLGLGRVFGLGDGRGLRGYIVKYRFVCSRVFVIESFFSRLGVLMLGVLQGFLEVVLSLPGLELRVCWFL
jgi:hypothetical protein